MKKQKAFTLIELLAVIVILAIIALIATPLVLNMIDNVKKGSFKASVQGIVKSADNNYYQDILKGKDIKEVIYFYEDYKESANVENRKLSYKGQKPETGNIIVTKVGNISLALHNGTWCATKQLDGDEIILNKTSKEDCVTSIPMPKIILNGGNEINIEIKTEYQELGYQASNTEGEDITDKVKVIITKSGTEVENITTDILSSYEIKYSVEDNDKYIEVTRKVNIVDTIPPELIIPEDISISVEEVAGFDVMAGVSATDNSGEIIIPTAIGTISELPGEYVITYKAIDSSGNETIKERNILVVLLRSFLRISDNNKGDFPYLNGPINKNKIESIEFATTNIVPSSVIGSWDVSYQNNGSIMAWYTDNNSNGLYELTIGGKDGVWGNEDSSYLFYYLTSLKTINLQNFNTNNIKNMYYMFGYATNLTSLDLSNFDTSNVINMGGMFSALEKVTSLNISSLDTSNVTNMVTMFSGLTLTSLDLRHFDTSNVTNMSFMFYDNTKLTNLNISSFNTSNVTAMSAMFSGVKSLTSLDLSHFDTSNVTSMSTMFAHVDKMTSLNISNFNTSKVTNMSNMFAFAGSLTSLDLRHFDTSKVTNMSQMFAFTENLTTLNISSFDTSKVTDMSGMFNYTLKLANLDFRNATFNSVVFNSLMFEYTKSGIVIYTKNTTTKSWLQSRLSEAGKSGTVTIAT